MIKFTHPHGKIQSKRYYQNQAKEIESLPIHRSTWWKAEEIVPSSLEHLLLSLKQLENQSSSFITLGELSQSAKIKLAHGELVRRTGVKRNGYEPTVIDVPSRFVCFDLDQARWPLNTDKHSVIREAIKLSLPEPFHDADVICQMSSSCKIKNHAQLKCHLFFELAQPRTLAQLKALTWWPTNHEDK